MLSKYLLCLVFAIVVWGGGMKAGHGAIINRRVLEIGLKTLLRTSCEKSDSQGFRLAV